MRPAMAATVSLERRHSARRWPTRAQYDGAGGAAARGIQVYVPPVISRESNSSTAPLMLYVPPLSTTYLAVLVDLARRRLLHSAAGIDDQHRPDRAAAYGLAGGTVEDQGPGVDRGGAGVGVRSREGESFRCRTSQPG